MKQDPLFWNKIAAAVIASGLLAMVIAVLARSVYSVPGAPDGIYVIAPEGGGQQTASAPASAEPAPPEPIGAMLAAADLDKGKKVAKKCVSCHGFEKGAPNKVGPHLFGVVGRDIASVADFNYSNALKGLDGAWGYEELNAYLTKPREYAPGTRMAFAGLKKVSDRANLIAYMRSMGDNPLPLP